MELVLVLLLFLLPGGHLVFHYFLIGVDIVLQDAAFLLNGVDLTIDLELNLLHLVLNDGLYVIGCQALLNGGALLVIHLIDYLLFALLPADQVLLEVTFYLQPLRHIVVHLYNLLEDGAFAHVIKDLLLHFLRELLARLLQLLGFLHILNVEGPNDLVDHVEDLQGHVALHIVLQSDPHILIVVHSAFLGSDHVLHFLERVDCRGLIKFAVLEDDDGFLHVFEALDQLNTPHLEGRVGLIDHLHLVFRHVVVIIDVVHISSHRQYAVLVLLR